MPSRQSEGITPNSFLILEQSNTEKAGRDAGVGYANVLIA